MISLFRFCLCPYKSIWCSSKDLLAKLALFNTNKELEVLGVLFNSWMAGNAFTIISLYKGRRSGWVANKGLSLKEKFVRLRLFVIQFRTSAKLDILLKEIFKCFNKWQLYEETDEIELSSILNVSNNGVSFKKSKIFKVFPLTHNSWRIGKDKGWISATILWWKCLDIKEILKRFIWK